MRVEYYPINYGIGYLHVNKHNWCHFETTWLNKVSPGLKVRLLFPISFLPVVAVVQRPWSDLRRYINCRYFYFLLYWIWLIQQYAIYYTIIWHLEPDDKNLTVAVGYSTSRQCHGSKQKISEPYKVWLTPLVKWQQCA